MPKRYRRSLAVALLCAACAGCGPGSIGPNGGDPDAGEPPECDPAENARPAAPTITEPQQGELDVIPQSMSIRTSTFSDPDGNGHAESEFEIWTTAGGQRLDRVWRARVSDPAKLTEVTLADGAFEGVTGLVEGDSYLVRARHGDDGEECAAWSDWSGDRSFKTDDGTGYLFDPDTVHSFYLDIPPSSWDPIDAEAIPPGCVPHSRNYYPGTLRFEGQVFDGVGIHVKGGCGSARNLNGKASFKVSLDWDDPAVPGCPTERRLHGEKHFTFNNMVQDPRQQAEMIGYQYYRDLGIPAPRAAYVKLYVNDEYWGVYTHVESIDRTFLGRWWPTNDGMVYEGTYWCDLVPGNVPPNDDDGYCITREFKPDACDTVDPGADPMTYDLVRQLVNQIDQMPQGSFYPEVTAFFDYDKFLTSWAIESVIVHWDAYEFQIMNNYRVHHDPTTGIWNLISTGIDQTFSGDLDPWGVGGTLAARCLQELDCEEAFAARLGQVADQMTSLGLRDRAAANYNFISPEVFADPRKEIDNGSYTNAVNEMLNFIDTRPGQIHQYLQNRGFE
jgi:hypothetical protein